ncbi:MAG: ribonuclease HII [Actinobacteria bacterium]|nr:ribonuclease HII [Actinomycetota bacterium]
MSPSIVSDLDHYERRLRALGFARVAGIDDSKALTRLQRERAYDRITEQAVAFAVCKAMPTRIDHRGMHRSNIALFRQVIRSLPVRPDYVLADGFPLRGFPLPHLSIKKGDAVTASVAAASIVAKVTRDRIMERLHRRYPDYGFDRNRGYGTPTHRAALMRLGPSPVHRHSYLGVATGYYPNHAGLELRVRASRG